MGNGVVKHRRVGHHQPEPSRLCVGEGFFWWGLRWPPCGARAESDRSDGYKADGHFFAYMQVVG